MTIFNENSKNRGLLTAMLVLLLALYVTPPLQSAHAQENIVGDDLFESDGADIYQKLFSEYEKKKGLQTINLNVEQFDTVLYTPWQEVLVKDAIVRFYTEEPEAADFVVDNVINEAPEIKGPLSPGIRELRLGGILYRSNKDWTIWLNGFRVTPKTLLDQIVDINVHKEYVELVWFDAYKDLIYPVRIKPHQRFNFDSRMFMPGAVVEN